MKKAFIFDVDGTLIDSNDFHAMAWEAALALHGKSVPARNIRPHIGKGGDKLLPCFLSQKEVDQFGKKIAEEQGRIFKEKYSAQIRPFPKVRELFKAIRERGARIALASSAKQQDVENAKTVAQITDLVETATSSEDAKESKPEPDIFHAALTLLGNPSSLATVVVGDSPYDALAAKRAGLNTIGLLCGGFPERKLKAAGCREIFEDPSDLLVNLDRIFHST